MRYGACTWIFGDEPLAASARQLSELGFDGVELFGDLSRDPRAARTVLTDHGLVVLSITPENVDIAHPDSVVRGPAVDYYLRLLDFAAEVGAPLVSCHGAVGRVRAVSSYEEEWRLYVEAVATIARRAEALGLRIAMELLNRYEAHLLNTAEDGLRFVEAVGASNVGLLLDAYHMNIEEPGLPLAIWKAGKRLFLFHAADSNRQAVGRGHTDFLALMHALRAIGYQGDVVLECTAPGPDPFTAIKGPDSLEWVGRYLGESLALLKHYERAV
jgi:sugar phosphate isomerase/epimerase